MLQPIGNMVQGLIWLNKMDFFRGNSTSVKPSQLAFIT